MVLDKQLYNKLFLNRRGTVVIKKSTNNKKKRV